VVRTQYDAFALKRLAMPMLFLLQVSATVLLLLAFSGECHGCDVHRSCVCEPSELFPLREGWSICRRISALCVPRSNQTVPEMDPASAPRIPSWQASLRGHTSAVLLRNTHRMFTNPDCGMCVPRIVSSQCRSVPSCARRDRRLLPPPLPAAAEPPPSLSCVPMAKASASS